MEPVITILQAEDDPLLRRSITQYLNTLGFKTLEAENGLEAWEIFQQRRPDLVLTDLRMPVMDGFELLEKMKEEGLAKDSIKVILSNRGQPSDITQAKTLGASGYIVKASSTPSEVIEKVVDIINKNPPADGKKE